MNFSSGNSGLPGKMPVKTARIEIKQPSQESPKTEQPKDQNQKAHVDPKRLQKDSFEKASNQQQLQKTKNQKNRATSKGTTRKKLDETAKHVASKATDVVADKTKKPSLRGRRRNPDGSDPYTLKNGTLTSEGVFVKGEESLRMAKSLGQGFDKQAILDASPVFADEYADAWKSTSKELNDAGYIPVNDGLAEVRADGTKLYKPPASQAGSKPVDSREVGKLYFLEIAMSEALWDGSAFTPA